MAFFKKTKENVDQNAVQGVQARSIAEQLAPLAEAGRFAVEQKEKLQNEEAVTIEGIEEIGDHFEQVKSTCPLMPVPATTAWSSTPSSLASLRPLVSNS